MKKLLLNENWRMRVCGEAEWLPARVPCSLISVLLEQKRTQDPYWRCNEEQTLALCRNDCEFCRTVTLDASFLQQRAVELVCEGLDTLAEIFVNGTLLAKTSDMHRTYRLNCKSLLHAGKNELHILFHSPVEYIENYHPAEGRESKIVPSGSMAGGHYLRKAQSMFGWDWGIQLPDMGIWRDIWLEAHDEPRLEGVELLQEHTENAVKLTVNVQTEQAGGQAGDLLMTSFFAPDGALLEQWQAAWQPETQFRFLVQSPQLWWPNGYGEHPLYRVEVTLLRGGEEQDRRSYSIGLRTLTVLHEPDEWGKSFAVCVNGLKIFTRGANYIPEDAIYPNIAPAKQQFLIETALKENMNCLRLWGGGYFPSDAFYEMCDRAGLMVWQDLLFACDTFELTPEFEENIIAETRDNVCRLRHHACLLLWCGNNEIESAWSHWGDFQAEPATLRADYIKIFEYILPRTVREFDKQTFYWASSPSSGGCICDPDAETDGDVHYWDVWHGRKPFTDYRKYKFRFCSEFGFQAFPSMKTICAFTKPQDRNIFSKVMESHQKNGSANGTILSYLSENFRYPGTLEGLVYLSQVLQGMAIKYGVEHWRRQRGQCMGSLFWQLNDNWPVVSWAAVDYLHRYKALHYMAAHFYAPVACSLLRDGTKVAAYVQNETAAVGHYQAKLRLRGLDGTLLDETIVTGEAAPYSALSLGEKDFAPLLSGRVEQVIAEIAFSGDGLQDTLEAEPFVPYKHLELKKVAIQKQIQPVSGGWQITLNADGVAPFVWLDLADGDGEFSDNCFLLNGQESKTVQLKTAGLSLPEGSTAEQQLTVTCLQDTYL